MFRAKGGKFDKVETKYTQKQNSIEIKFGSLSPIFKWTGGKRREIKHLTEFFPAFIGKERYTYVEPFVGGGAIFFYLNNIEGENIISDFDHQVSNFYARFANGSDDFLKPLRKIGKITDHDELEARYYSMRNADKDDGLDHLSPDEQAVRFFVVNQLAFSGMRRFNASGEFNVPFGHYKGINTDVVDSDAHRLLLKKTTIRQGDFQLVMQDNDNPNTFVFLDPPYTRIFKEYSADNSFGEKEHRRLSDTIRSMKKASVMMVIDKSPFTEELYADMIKSSYGLKYGVNIKNRFNTAVEHLIITNY